MPLHNPPWNRPTSYLHHVGRKWLLHYRSVSLITVRVKPFSNVMPIGLHLHWSGKLYSGGVIYLQVVLLFDSPGVCRREAWTIPIRNKNSNNNKTVAWPIIVGPGLSWLSVPNPAHPGDCWQESLTQELADRPPSGTGFWAEVTTKVPPTCVTGTVDEGWT